ncbi:hypothetical protein KAF25_002794 [Fusarium avenaceum]|uniref:Pyridoxamine phosphate oxidase family protein n=1 Tax=Fusarium avenaceum TaxID=40199 RepID=A0A9P7KPQ8_9HYPO|nr:hypothetical protein KAF25_002794 [Fusarium avenaceum]
MKLYPSIPEDLADWVQKQPVFFTGSAPTQGSHINVSPKGADSHFAVLTPNTCAYIDRTGSGCETIAHSYDNGRLCLMFMSFGPAPRIVRFFCRSRIVEWDDPSFPTLVRTISKNKRDFDGARAVILADVFEVQTSCGFGVPRVKRGIYAPEEASQKDLSLEQILQEGVVGKVNELAVFEERPTMDVWAGKQVEANTMLDYHKQTNVLSMDGLPGLRAARRSVGETLWFTDAKARARKVFAQSEAIAVGFVLALLLYVVMFSVGAISATWPRIVA